MNNCTNVILQSFIGSQTYVDELFQLTFKRPIY